MIRNRIQVKFRTLYRETKYNLVHSLDRFSVTCNGLYRSAREKNFITIYVTSLQGMPVFFCYSRLRKTGNQQIYLAKPTQQTTSECGDHWEMVPKFNSKLFIVSEFSTLKLWVYSPYTGRKRAFSHTHTLTHADITEGICTLTLGHSIKGCVFIKK
jgi:hypothetical protein